MQFANFSARITIADAVERELKIRAYYSNSRSAAYTALLKA